MAHAAKARRGPFITFEGGDGVGKSTQIALLAERLKNFGHDVVVTREPGGSAGAEAIRELLVKGDAERWSSLTEALLMYASRADHLQRTINPARDRGAVVISDRFSDSTMAYQGIAGDLRRDAVEKLEALVVASDGPDLTIILDAPASAGLERATTRGGDNRFESKGDAYQERVRQAYLDIAAANPKRCVVIDAGGAVDAVSKRIAEALRERLSLDL